MGEKAKWTALIRQPVPLPSQGGIAIGFLMPFPFRRFCVLCAHVVEPCFAVRPLFFSFALESLPWGFVQKNNWKSLYFANPPPCFEDGHLPKGEGLPLSIFEDDYLPKSQGCTGRSNGGQHPNLVLLRIARGGGLGAGRWRPSPPTMAPFKEN